jgi:glycosyltransferase involved in cell wall biosynthesis
MVLPVERPLRILMVTPRYLPEMGGVETHVAQVAPRLVRAGADVTVLTTDRTRTLPSHEMANGVTILRVPATPARRDYYFAPGIVPIIRRGNWDVVHCQSYHTLVAPMAMMAARQAGLPYVVTFHGGGHSSQLRNKLRGGQWALLRPLFARAARLVAIARFEIELYGRRLGVPDERFVLIPNGADLPPISGGAAGADTDLIVSVGRLEWYKGHHRAIAALPLLLRERPTARLRIVGAGPEEANLRKLALRLGVAERVEIGPVPPADREAMASLLARAALVTLLSDYETHPIAALEALALGRPVLVCHSSGMAELAERGLARSVLPDDGPAAVAQGMLAQLRRPLIPPPLALPTWNDCAARLLDLYHAVAWRSAPCVS